MAQGRVPFPVYERLNSSGLSLPDNTLFQLLLLSRACAGQFNFNHQSALKNRSSGAKNESMKKMKRNSSRRKIRNEEIKRM